MAQHRRRRPHLTLTVHNPTTAHDLQPPSSGEPRHRTAHRHLAAANARRLRHLNNETHTTVTLRVDTGAPPLRLLRDAEEAARSGDHRSLHPVDPAAHARSPWDELRVWDPGD